MSHVRNITLATIMCLVAAGLASGCVTTETFDKKVAELNDLRAFQAANAEAKQKKLEADLEQLRKDLEARLAAAKADLAKVTAEREELRKQLDDGTALTGELKKRLEKLGQNVDKLTSEKGQLSTTLEDAKARLEELRKQKASAEALASTFKDLVDKLRSMIDSGQIKVVVREGRMLIALPNDILFESGKTDVKVEGQKAIANVAHVLMGMGDHNYLVAGHTDDVPIHTTRFPTNWELSTARAVEVTKILVVSGMKPQTLAAAGYGEFDPVVLNDSAEHRAQNRRIEVVLQPNLADLPNIEKLVSTTEH